MPDIELDERRHECLTELLASSHRSAVPIREAFLQTRGRPPTPGPLSELVRGQHEHALDVYLLLHAGTATPPHQLYVNPDFWALLARRPSQSLRNARQALHRSLDILESLELVEQRTKLGVPLFQLLEESGWGDAYVHPYHTAERYFTLPHRYWDRGLDRTLGMPGKVMLLIARSLKPQGFTLPLAHATDWYGISPDTLRRGMRELIDSHLVYQQAAAESSDPAPLRLTIRRTYKLAGSMARDVEAQEKEKRNRLGRS